MFWLVINFDSISGKGIHMVTALRQRTPFQTHPPTHNVQLTFCVVTWVWTAPLTTYILRQILDVQSLFIFCFILQCHFLFFIFIPLFDVNYDKSFPSLSISSSTKSISACVTPGLTVIIRKKFFSSFNG